MAGPAPGGPAPEPALAGPGSGNADAAAYQRLRGHLAYLKLNAAIEALPGVLDSARDGQLSVLAALEQLMAAEAAAAEARKLAVRLHFAALPAPWRLEDYDFSAQPGADPALIGELATLRFVADIATSCSPAPPAPARPCWRPPWPAPPPKPATKPASPRART